MTDHEKFQITQSEEYKTYIAALCRLASGYIPEIRRQLAEKALENFQNETLRRLVLAYGEEIQKLDADRLREFSWAASNPETGYSLEDSCLNNAEHYAAAIKLFFLDK